MCGRQEHVLMWGLLVMHAGVALYGVYPYGAGTDPLEVWSNITKGVVVDHVLDIRACSRPTRVEECVTIRQSGEGNASITRCTYNRFSDFTSICYTATARVEMLPPSAVSSSVQHRHQQALSANKTTDCIMRLPYIVGSEGALTVAAALAYAREVHPVGSVVDVFWTDISSQMCVTPAHGALLLLGTEVAIGLFIFVAAVWLFVAVCRDEDGGALLFPSPRGCVASVDGHPCATDMMTTKKKKKKHARKLQDSSS